MSFGHLRTAEAYQDELEITKRRLEHALNDDNEARRWDGSWERKLEEIVEAFGKSSFSKASGGRKVQNAMSREVDSAKRRIRIKLDALRNYDRYRGEFEFYKRFLESGLRIHSKPDISRHYRFLLELLQKREYMLSQTKDGRAFLKEMDEYLKDAAHRATEAEKIVTLEVAKVDALLEEVTELLELDEDPDLHHNEALAHFDSARKLLKRVLQMPGNVSFKRVKKSLKLYMKVKDHLIDAVGEYKYTLFEDMTTDEWWIFTVSEGVDDHYASPLDFAARQSYRERERAGAVVQGEPGET